MFIRERHIKAALIDGLFSEKMVDGDTVVVSEMPVFGMARRADLVLANGRLIGFEIKSNADSVERLRGQISAYSSYFEGVVVICGSRHLEKVLSIANEAVGVFVFEEHDQMVGVAKPVRKPRIRNMDAETAIRQMLATDLRKVIRKAGIKTDAFDRASLERTARDLDINSLRQGALSSIKARYRPQFSAFVEARANNVATIDALPLLRRPPWRSNPPVAHAELTTEDTQDVTPIYVKPRRV